MPTNRPAALPRIVLAYNLPGLQSYSTAFPLTENPISEGGRWINGGTTGLDWADIQTTPGLAFSVTPPGGTTDPNDQTAILTGSWAPNVLVTCVADHNPVATVNFRELEIRLRSTLSAHVSNGYELNWGIGALGPYHQLVRWLGPHGGSGVGFNILVDPIQGHTDGGGGLVDCPLVGDGYTCSAQISGTVITTTVTGGGHTWVSNAMDLGALGGTIWTGGNPGMGFYNQVTNAYGWKSFSVTEI